MAALYAVQYAGKTGVGVGAMYFGDGVIAGFDIYGGRYKGKYTESGGHIKCTVALSMPDGGELVTGQQVPTGTSINIQADWPADLGNGKALQLTVSGQAVAVTFNKMQDIPRAASSRGELKCLAHVLGTCHKNGWFIAHHRPSRWLRPPVEFANVPCRRPRDFTKMPPFVTR